MCRSVPQIEAARTRTSTSVGPIVGTGTASSCAPCSGRILRRAFIVAVGIRGLGGRQDRDVNIRPTGPEAASKTDDALRAFRYNRPARKAEAGVERQGETPWELDNACRKFAR